MAWNAEGTGFFYTRYPHAGERPPEDLDFYQQVWFHRLGSDAKDDTYEVGKEFPRIAEVELSTSDDGKWIVASVANGDGGEYSHWVRPTKKGGAFKRFADHGEVPVHAASKQRAAAEVVERLPGDERPDEVPGVVRVSQKLGRLRLHKASCGAGSPRAGSTGSSRPWH